MNANNRKWLIFLALSVLTGCAHTGREENAVSFLDVSPAKIVTFDVESYFDATTSGLGFPFTDTTASGQIQPDAPISGHGRSNR